MPAFEPTAKDRETVERVAAFGLPHEDICQLVINPRTGKAISGETLRSAFRKELDRGRAKGAKSPSIGRLRHASIVP